MHTQQTPDALVLDKLDHPQKGKNSLIPESDNFSEIYQQHVVPSIYNQVWIPPEIVAQSSGSEGPSKPKKPGSKPLPDPPRSHENVENMLIYALLVGINEYQTPVAPLNGCIKDVDAVAEYLRELYGDGSPTMIAPPDSGSNGGGFFAPIMDFFTGEDNEGDFPAMEENGKLRLLILKDEQATRANIIKGFEEHLAKATSRDTVWFHFSGHGAQQFTADEFFEPRKRRSATGEILADAPDDPPLNPSGKDQCLVCFTPGDTDENRGVNHQKRFLADKELAKLIKGIESTGRSSEGTKPHVLVSVDACNSGSISRDPVPGFTPRLHDPEPLLARSEAIFIPGKIKKLEDYYGNYTPDNLRIPDSLHLALSASQSNQLSWDGSNGGIFTSSLIHVLKEAREKGKHLDYNEVFLRTRSHAKQLQDDREIQNPQNPQFQSYGGFDPYVAFLEGWRQGTPGRYKLFHKKGNWYIRCGAIHGIPSHSDTSEDSLSQKVKVKIFPVEGDQDTHVSAFIDKVAAQYSLLSIHKEEEVELNELLPIDQRWEGEVSHLPGSPVYILVTGAPDLVDTFLNSTERGRLKNKNIILTDESEGHESPEARISLEEDFSIHIHNLRVDKRIAFLSPGNRSQFITIRDDLMNKGLENIANAKRFIELGNPDSKIGKMFDARLILKNNRPSSETILSVSDIPEGQGTFRRVVVHANQEDHEITSGDFNEIIQHQLSCNLQIHMDRIPQTLHFYSYFILPNAKIGFYSEEEESVFFEKDKEDRTFTKNLREGSEIAQLTLNPDDVQDTFWLKVIATTEELDFQLLTQQGIQSQRDFTIGQPHKISNDWATVTFEIQFTKTPPSEEV